MPRSCGPLTAGSSTSSCVNFDFSSVNSQNLTQVTIVKTTYWRMAKQIANPDLPAPPSGKYPAKSHCRRVAKWLAENGGPSSGVIYLEGQALKENEVSNCRTHHKIMCCYTDPIE